MFYNRRKYIIDEVLRLIREGHCENPQVATTLVEKVRRGLSGNPWSLQQLNEVL
jgi:hypothetical protein